jgi:hypothetical protein
MKVNRLWPLRLYSRAFPRGPVPAKLRAAMKLAEGLRNDALLAALKDALAGRPQKLHAQLEILSGLPGTRVNTALASAFATECARAGAPADRVAFEMARLAPDVAPGGSPREFLPVCGVLALAARAALEPELRAEVLAHLHDAAEDPRFRVRDAVPPALARIGEKLPDALAADVATWTDGYHQAAAVLLALSDPRWLSALKDQAAVLARLDEAFALARDAPRSAVRWPGWKALADALGTAPGAVAARFGVPVFDLLASWAKVEMPELREAIEKNLRSKALAGRHGAEIERVRAALGASAPVPRDPTILVQGMRGRGKKRRR